jgi:hypothetical protein
MKPFEIKMVLNIKVVCTQKFADVEQYDFPTHISNCQTITSTTKSKIGFILHTIGVIRIASDSTKRYI